MAIVITVCNTKGGTTKSYISAQFALNLYERGVTVALLDADHEQLTSSEWLKEAAPQIPVAVTGVPKEIKEKIRELSKFADVVIVDTPGSSSPASFAATLLADIALIPLQPSETDVATLHKSIEAIGVAHEATEGKKPEALIVLTLTVTLRDAQAKNLRAALLADLPHRVAKSEIRRYVILREAKGKRLSQMEGEEARKAEADIKALVNEVLCGKLPGFEPPQTARLKRAGNE